MKVVGNKLDLVLARQCKNLTDLRTDLSPSTLAKIRNGENLRPKTIGLLARLLECDPVDIVEEA